MVVPGEERSDDWQKAREIAKARNYKQNNTDSDQFNVGTLLKMTTGMDLEQLALYVKMKTEADRLKEYVTPSLSRMISPQVSALCDIIRAWAEQHRLACTFVPRQEPSRIENMYAIIGITRVGFCTALTISVSALRKETENMFHLVPPNPHLSPLPLLYRHLPQTLDSIKGDDNGRPEGPFVLRSRSANSSEE